MPGWVDKVGIGAFGLFASLFMLATAPAGEASEPPRPQHVFIIVLENEGYHITFGAGSPATYLDKLAKQGALLQNYYAIGHFSLDNYLAMISGQAPNPVTQSDCQKFVEFVQTGTAPDGQALGSGCVYPASVRTLANQLEDKGLNWKGYMEDMGNIPSRESATCGHPAIGQADGTQRAAVGDQYATRHDPFMYFHAIIDRPSCDRHVVNLRALQDDLKSVETTPNYAFITPNLCHDGHDGGGEKKERRCVDGEPGGLVSADLFLKETIPTILASPAFKKDGLLIVTFDEADLDVKYDEATKSVEVEGGDAAACCGEGPAPNIGPGAVVFGNVPDKGPGAFGPGGGRIGAVLLSPLIKPGTVSQVPYNHYSLLRSVEDFFGLDHLGYAATDGLRPFGRDVFTKSRQ
ncbi:MAG TPA: alkaline phosphatase family protein [Alphaproteobacteria bacterium]|nr:alkaline phosphatase family protein [Alphaproteobacteria bacterium]